MWGECEVGRGVQYHTYVKSLEKKWKEKWERKKIYLKVFKKNPGSFVFVFFKLNNIFYRLHKTYFEKVLLRSFNPWKVN
jgi:hypothetical protein